MNRIVWLASYPKSGNTWMRAFLSNLTPSRKQPADINNLDISGVAGDRSGFDDALAVSSSNLSRKEIDRYRPEFYRHLARNSSRTPYLKTHDAFAMVPEREPLFPPEVSQGALYLVRNPLDVVISFAHHGSRTIDEMIDFMADEQAALASCPTALQPQLPQQLRSWSSHVASWLDQKLIAVQLVRYEDMHTLAPETFAQVARFLNLSANQPSLLGALQRSSFDTLRRQEQERGFVERPATSAAFFRSGRVGEWQEVLSRAQIQRIVEAHGEIMQRLGYLSGSEREI